MDGWMDGWMDRGLVSTGHNIWHEQFCRLSVGYAKRQIVRAKTVIQKYIFRLISLFVEEIKERA